MQGYHRVKEIWSKMLAGEEEATREWLVEAEKLVECFRETRNLFLTSRVGVSRVSAIAFECSESNDHSLASRFPRNVPTFSEKAGTSS